MSVATPTAQRTEATTPRRELISWSNWELDDVASRLGWSLANLFLAFLGFSVWAGSSMTSSANLASITIMFGGLAGVLMCWLGSRAPGWRLQLAVMALLAAGLGFFAVQQWLLDPSYGTDSVAFNQYAADLAVHGLNPFTHSMQPALQQFHVASIYATYRLDGTAVDRLSYPVGSFLFYMPLLAAGVTAQAANVVDVAFWGLSMLLMWLLLPARVKWVAPLLMSALVYVSFSTGGLTDAVFVPFVLLALWRWDSYADPAERSVARWVGPIALGVAMSIKQTPWFLLPFLLVGVWFESRARGQAPARTAARYLASAVVVFTLVNLDYLLAAPGAWLRGVLEPLVDHTIPDGQGLVDLSIFNGLGGGRLGLFSVAGAATLALSVLGLALFYNRLKRAWVPLIALTFFLPTRSFGGYLFMMIPGALLAAASVRPATPGTAVSPPRLLRLAWVALGGVALTAAVAAVTWPSPLAVKITDTRSTGQLRSLDEIQVQVTNHTSHTMRPHFTVNAINRVTTFWYPFVDGHAVDAVVGPHQTRTWWLHAPNAPSMPAIDDAVLVEAFTQSPAALSTSPRYLVGQMRAYITPDAVNEPVPVGHKVTLTVQLQDRLGTRVRQAGVPIAFAQIVYSQNAILAAESSINGHPTGESPILAYTDADGQAVFTVRGTLPQSEPVYYQAWIGRLGSTPYGYSNQVFVQFEKPSDGP